MCIYLYIYVYCNMIGDWMVNHINYTRVSWVTQIYGVSKYLMGILGDKTWESHHLTSGNPT